MSTPTVLAAKGALVALLDANTDDTTYVSWGLPDWEPDDMVVVGGATGTLSPRAMGTTATRDEQYGMTATVSVYRGGTDQRLVTERAWAIFDDVESTIRTNPTLSGTVQSASVAGYDMEEALSLGEGDAVVGRICEIIVRVEIRARV